MRYLSLSFLVRREAQLLKGGFTECLSVAHDGYFGNIFKNADVGLNIVPEHDGRYWLEIEFKNDRLSSRTIIADGTNEELLAFLKDDQRSAEANVDRVIATYFKFDRVIDEDDWCH